MTYDPLIPAAGDILSQSQQDIQTNFSQANTIFGSDHVEFDDSTASNRGLHKQVTMFEALTSAPTAINAQGIIYPLVDVNDTSLRTQAYFRNQSSNIQITNRFKLAAADGYVMIPGNISGPAIILMWGFEPVPATQTATINFTPIGNYNYTGGQTFGFPNNCFMVNTTVGTDDTTEKTCSVKNGSTTKEHFVVKLSSLAINGVYWFAIGN